MTEIRERAVAFVVARLSSSRLPAKQLRHIGPKSIIEWIMDALADCETR
jgi:spore coat polysaccharide biosynthesis protein SpsF (cytidylyltransferase family)